MTKYFIFPVLFAAITMACSSSTTTQAGECTTPECMDEGEAGSTSVGGSGVGGSNVANGGGTSTGTVGSTGSTPNVGGNASTGGSGTVAGTGGATTGTGGGSAVCTTPVTCADVAAAANISATVSDAAACGFISDGCGGILDCGACVSDGTVNTGCGEEPTTNGNDWSSWGIGTVPNICGTRCTKNTEVCAGYSLGGQDGWICPSSVPPMGVTGCVKVSTRVSCCDPTT